MKWRKRVYTLNGRKVSSADVLGFVHTARRKEGLCYACRKPIKIGEKYVVLNNFPMLGDPVTVHLDEYVYDHSDGVILGVKTTRKRDFLLRRSTGCVECKLFKVENGVITIN